MEIATLIREAQYSAARTCRRLDLFAHAREVRFHIALVPPVVENCSCGVARIVAKRLMIYEDYAYNRL